MERWENTFEQKSTTFLYCEVVSAVQRPTSLGTYHFAAGVYKALIAEAKHRFFFNFTLPSMSKNNPQQFSNIVNPSERSQPKLENADGERVAANECASMWNDVFTKSFLSVNNSCYPEFSQVRNFVMNPIDIDYRMYRCYK